MIERYLSPGPFEVVGGPFELRRAVQLPDRLRLARYRKEPELGPRLLFFSGGTALNPLSRKLVEYTHNSIHLTTPFDSGGSSGKLRQVFDVPAVGDLRSRLMSLADRSFHGQAEVYDLFAQRLPTDASARDLRAELLRFASGDHPLAEAIVPPLRNLICNHLRLFVAEMPDSLDLRGASIGNLVLVGGYLNNRRDLEPVIYLFSKLVEVRGTVRPIVPDSGHLAATLEDGTTVVGQHRITGKEVAPLASRVREIFVTDHLERGHRQAVAIRPFVRKLIRQADVICFPMGSFYTSIIANLLPAGVGACVAANGCPKVYVPNTGCDPEQFGMKLSDCVSCLLRHLRADGDASMPVQNLLNFVLLDRNDESYHLPVDVAEVERLGVAVIRADLLDGNDPPTLDAERIIALLLSLT